MKSDEDDAVSPNQTHRAMCGIESGGSRETVDDNEDEEDSGDG